jgi:hypothetical protein
LPGRRVNEAPGDRSRPGQRDREHGRRFGDGSP